MLRLLLIISFVSSHAFASASDDSFFDSLRTDNFSVTKFEFCDPSGKSDDRFIYSKFPHVDLPPVEWRPDGLGNYPQPPICAAETLESVILHSPNEETRKQAIQNYFNTCGERLESFHYSNTRAMAMFSGARYAYCNHPRVRRLTIKFDDGTKLSGIVAVQRADASGIDQPRPLVIYKCGVFCETEDSSTKLMVMHMFDQAPFNVIAVGNNTSADYAAANNHIAIGGYDEGMQLLKLARIIRNSPLSKLTTSIHVVGMSLAGHAALMSSYLNEQNLDAMNFPYYSSTMSLCPVVDLKPSVEFLFADNVRGRVSREVLMRNVAKKKAQSPLLREFYDKLDNVAKISLIPGIISEYSTSYYSKRPADWALPPLNKTPITTTDSLWKLNNFFNYVSTPLNTPTLVFGASTDWVVIPEANSLKLDAYLKNSGVKTELKTVIVPDGNHCAFAGTYGWDTISRLYEGYVMSHAPEMQARKHHLKVALDSAKYFTGKLALRPGDRYVRMSLELTAGSPFAKMTATIWGSDGLIDKACKTMSIYNGTSRCLRTGSTNISLSELGPWAHVPATEPEAEQLTRWANYNLRYLHNDGSALIGSQEPPSVILWDAY